MANADILFRLEQTLLARKGAGAGSSYVASLYAKGLDAVLKKVGEEATEAIIPVHTNGTKHQEICVGYKS